MRLLSAKQLKREREPDPPEASIFFVGARPNLKKEFQAISNV